MTMTMTRTLLSEKVDQILPTMIFKRKRKRNNSEPSSLGLPNPRPSPHGRAFRILSRA